MLETEFLICRQTECQTGDKWQWKTLFLAIFIHLSPDRMPDWRQMAMENTLSSYFYPLSSIVKSFWLPPIGCENVQSAFSCTEGNNSVKIYFIALIEQTYWIWFFKSIFLSVSKPWGYFDILYSYTELTVLHKPGWFTDDSHDMKVLIRFLEARMKNEKVNFYCHNSS